MEIKPKTFAFGFEMDHQCSNGEEVFVSLWNSEENNPFRSFKMNLNRGHRWTAFGTSLPPSFHYKYFIRSSEGNIKWEQRGRRIVHMTRAELAEEREGKAWQVWLKDRWESDHSDLFISRRQWWKECIVYQIYPRSFSDSNGDGVGDIRGIINKLDYIEELGVNVVWLCPVYKSPNDDNGYDISDYYDINGEFGTMNDIEELIHELHKRGIKLIMDLVVNHTSDEHPWFIKSKSSKENNPYRDYYVWKPPNPITGKEPNNWVSFFGGSVWEFDEQSGEYYLHLFSKKQPDLNWENPKVREEIWKMMNFWLQKGIDGFRMDVINVISKDPNFPNAQEKVPDVYYHWGGDYFVNGPRFSEYLLEMKEKVLSKYEHTFTVGETPFFNTNDAVTFTNEGKTGVLNMLFHFELMDVDTVPGMPKWETRPSKLSEIKDIMTGWQLDLQGKGWNSLYLENHDQPRSVSRWGDEGQYRVESAKMLATWLHMMQGTPYIFQGEELGQTNSPYESINDYRDIETLRYYTEAMANAQDEKKVMRSIYAKSRDNSRAPMPWSSAPNAGFTTGTPWIKPNPNYYEVNVEKEKRDPNSVLNYYKNLIKIRKDHPIVVYGIVESLLDDHDQIYAYVRRLNGKKLLVVANFSKETPTFNLPTQVDYTTSKLLISNYDVDDKQGIKQFQLRPYEARVYMLQS